MGEYLLHICKSARRDWRLFGQAQVDSAPTMEAFTSTASYALSRAIREANSAWPHA